MIRATLDTVSTAAKPKEEAHASLFLLDRFHRVPDFSLRQ
jgi:hypothetical protein